MLGSDEKNGVKSTEKIVISLVGTRPSSLFLMEGLKMKKRIFALVLAIAICLSLLPMMAFAEEAKYRLDWKEGSRSNPNCPVTITWERNSHKVNVSYDSTGDYFILENLDVAQETVLYKQNNSTGEWSLVQGVSTRILSAGNVRSGNNYGSVSIGFFDGSGEPYAFTDGVYGIDFRIGANGFHSTREGGERFIIKATDPNSTTPSAIGEYDGHRYEVYNMNMTWKEAKEFCESRGGYLATVSSDAENNYILNLIKQGDRYNYWLGGYKNNNNWFWVTDEPFSYNKWAPGEPNNTGNAEAFIHISGAKNNAWNDLKNDGDNTSGYHLSLFGFVCEYGKVESPKPKTMNLEDLLGYYEGYFTNSQGRYTTYMTVYKEGSVYKVRYEWTKNGKELSSLSTMTLKEDGTVFADAGDWIVSPNDSSYLVSVNFLEFDGKILTGKNDAGGQERYEKVDNPKPTTQPPSGDQINGFVGESISSGVKLWWGSVRGGVGYRVFRSTNQSEEGVSATDFYITSNEFVDVNVDANMTYYYTVRQVIKEARTFEGLKEELGPITTKITVRTGQTILGGNASDSPEPKKFVLMTLDDPYMSVNGVREEIDPGRGTTPLILNSRTVVPIRAIVEAMGGTVNWNDYTRKISLNYKNQAVVMTLNGKTITVNGTSKTIDVAPAVINSRTMVPIRFAAENLGCDVDWLNSKRQIVIVYR